VQAEKKVKELTGELDDLSQRLDEAGGATQAQVSELILMPTCPKVSDVQESLINGAITNWILCFIFLFSRLCISLTIGKTFVLNPGYSCFVVIRTYARDIPFKQINLVMTVIK